MKVECTKRKLYDAISKADKITGKNATLPVLSCVLLEAKEKSLVVRATNLDLGIEISIPVKVLQEGVVAIPSSLFVSYISNLGDDENITLELIKGTLSVTSSHNETQIKTLAHDDFPTIPQLEANKTFTITSSDLISGLKSVWYSSSVSSMKPELSSVYVYPDGGLINFVATDSFRLAEKKVKVPKTDSFESVLIPFRNVGEIIRIFDAVSSEIEVRFDSNQIAFATDDVYVVSRIVDGTFPDYGQIIPKENTTEVVVLKQDLIQALKLSNLFSDKFNQITMTVRPNDGVFEIQSKNVDRGENRNVVDATLRGDDIEINFNQKYIVDSFASIPTETVTLYFNGTSKPMVMRGIGDTTFMYLVMPMNK